MVRLRTRLLDLLMRSLSFERRRRLPSRWWFRPFARFISRGELQVLSGVAWRARLSGAHFPYWGAQAIGVLAGTHETMVQEALRRTLGPGGVFIDVGCNLGYTSLQAARLVGASGRVVAIDPQIESVEATRVNAALNGFDQVEVLHAAAAARTGQVEVIVTQDSLWTRLASVGEHELETRRELVPAVALDDLGLDRADVVKIDVEGGELEVIAGMRRMLAEQRPTLVCEMHGKNQAFVETLAELGYRVVNLDGPEPVERSGDNVHALCEPVYSSAA